MLGDDNTKKNKIVILIGALVLCVIIMATLILIYHQKNKNTDIKADNYSSTDTYSEQSYTENNAKIEEEKVTNSENNWQTETDLHNGDTNVENKTQAPSVTKEQYTENDKTVIATFDNIEKDVDNLLQEEKTETVKDKLKGTFITIVDFIFYDAEIKGIRFDDLTEGAKQNILETANTIDNKIEKSFPGYKETISDKTKSAYNKASEVIKKGANSVKDFSKEKLGEENYNAIIDAKDELVYYIKNAFDIVGNVTSNLWEQGKSKIKSWYEKFRNN